MYTTHTHKNECHRASDINTADILSKHWGYSQIRERLKSLLFLKGDTVAIIVENPILRVKEE
jgi:hypothetical protein